MSRLPTIENPQRKPYPSDLSDAEWVILKPLLPTPKGFGHPVEVDFREILNAIFYVQRTGCQWEMLPHDLPPYTTVYGYFQKWQRKGIWQQIHDQVRHILRQDLGRTVLVPMAGGSLVDPSLKLVLEAIGFETVREVSCMEEVIAGDLRIRALPFLGEHADLDIRCKAAWLVEAESMRLLFAADSNNLDPVLYDRLAPLIGHVDTLFIGMECRGAPMSWMYGTLLPEAVERSKDQSRRLDGSDCERAKAIISSLDIEQVCVYAMGMEPWLKFISSLDPTADSPALQESKALIDHCNHLGLPAERLYGRSESLFLTEYYL